jgi:hypothetical protein
LLKQFMSAVFVLALLTSLPASAAEIPFKGEFKIPALRIVWAELNRPTAAEMRLDWRDLDPRKDTTHPDDFWRHWPAPFSPFYAGVKMPAEAFTLTALYPDGKLVYPQATYDPNVDYQTFFDLHESLAWLYAFDSPANPFHGDRALGLRAEQLALAHLLYMTQEVPGGNIIGGWPIQYGNCVAWSAHTLALLDHTVALDPKLKQAWIDCLDHILKTLDAGGPEMLQTGMGHWNFWPVCGAFRLWQVSRREEHKALFEKWAKTQLEPDLFTTVKADVSGMSPVGYCRYSGVDLGYNGQAKNWMAPLFAVLGPDSIVGDFARRQYRFASFVTLQEPDGSFTSPQHMNSHSTQSVPFEQWAGHGHLAYAAKIPDAVPFAGGARSTGGGKEAFLAAQQSLRGVHIKVLAPMAMGVRSYPSNYLHLPEALDAYPTSQPADGSIRTRPHEHLAYAKFFASPRVRDEWFMRRTPAYHATVFSGPCRDEVSNYGGRLNGIGSGGLSHVWADGAGTLLIGFTDLLHKPSPDGDFDAVWSQLPVNMSIAETKSGKVLCTGWTGALMSPPAGNGRKVHIEGGVAPKVARSYTTPMTNRFHWQRTLEFGDDRIAVNMSLEAAEPIARVEEVLPVAFFADTTIASNTLDGWVADTWDGARKIRALQIKRGKAGVHIEFPADVTATWAKNSHALSGISGSPAKVRGLRIAFTMSATAERAEFRYKLDFFRDDQATTPVVTLADGKSLKPGKRGDAYRLCVEAPDAKARYWDVVSGKLPPGVSLNRNGLLSGTPAQSGEYRFDLVGRSPYHDRPFNEVDVTMKAIKLAIDLPLPCPAVPPASSGTSGRSPRRSPWRPCGPFGSACRSAREQDGDREAPGPWATRGRSRR